MKLSGDSRVRSSRIGTSTSRGEVSPFSKRTSVRVGLKSTPERAEPPLVLTMTLAAPRDPPLRVTSTNAVPLASPTVNARAAQLHRAGVRAWSRGAARGAVAAVSAAP